MPKGQTTDEQLEKAIYAELDRLKTEPVTQKELEKIYNKVDLNYVRLMENPMSIAVSLAQAPGRGNGRILTTGKRQRRLLPKKLCRLLKNISTRITAPL
jgi:predicted Zn-dependent peptidase